MTARLVIDLTDSAPEADRVSPFYYAPKGACRAIFGCQDPEVLIHGPKDTGKTRAWLSYVMWCMATYPGARALICRKSRASITQSIQVTLERKVLPPGHGVNFHGTRGEYQLANGSVIVLGGLSDHDGAMRVQSSEYDLIYVPEATELSEHELEMLSGLLRNSVMPYQQLGMDCNPGPSTHWLRKRFMRGQTTAFQGRHEDNPSITPERLARLAALTGVRRQRLYEGLWVSAEGAVYAAWSPDQHVTGDFRPPGSWRRVWAVDFGFTNPFVWQDWAEDPDGRLFLVREIYQTRRIVADHARHIKVLTADDPRPEAIICDHDAEDRATLERELGMRTEPAFKSVSAGIEAVQARLRVDGTGRPRLAFMAGALVETDPLLDNPEEGPPRPTSTAAEMESYVWNPAKDQPVKRDDHGLDAMRYVVAYVDDLRHGAPSVGIDRPDDDWRIREYAKRPETAGLAVEAW